MAHTSTKRLLAEVMVLGQRFDRRYIQVQPTVSKILHGIENEERQKEGRSDKTSCQHLRGKLSRYLIPIASMIVSITLIYSHTYSSYKPYAFV